MRTHDTEGAHANVGSGRGPSLNVLVMIHESHSIAGAAAADGTITDQMVLLCPEPTIFTKHTFASLRPEGARLGQFLANDPELRSPATTFGFRTSDTAAFRSFVSSHQLAIPDNLIDVIEPPTYETLEAMITRLEQLYTGSGAAPAPSGDAP